MVTGAVEEKGAKAGRLICRQEKHIVVVVVEESNIFLPFLSVAGCFRDFVVVDRREFVHQLFDPLQSETRKEVPYFVLLVVPYNLRGAFPERQTNCSLPHLIDEACYEQNLPLSLSSFSPNKPPRGTSSSFLASPLGDKEEGEQK